MDNKTKFIENCDIEVLAKIAIERLAEKTTITISNFKKTNDIKYKNKYLELITDREKILDFDKETIIKYCIN